MLKTLGNNTDWQDIKEKLEEVYSPIVTEVHAASDLHKSRDQTKYYTNIYKT